MSLGVSLSATALASLAGISLGATLAMCSFPGRRLVVPRHRRRHGRGAQYRSRDGAYTLSDRGTWLSFTNQRNLTVLVDGDPRLLNRYDVILLDPKKHAAVKQEPARRFASWLASPAGQSAIGAYKVDGEQLFHPSAPAPK